MVVLDGHIKLPYGVDLISKASQLEDSMPSGVLADSFFIYLSRTYLHCACVLSIYSRTAAHCNCIAPLFLTTPCQ